MKLASKYVKGKKYYVTYYAKPYGGGKLKQVWESFETEEEADTRILEVELLKKKNALFAPTKMTFSELCDIHAKNYGLSNWGVNTYSSNIGYYKNHIKPYFGSDLIVDITRLQCEHFINYMEKKTYQKGRLTKSYSQKTIREVCDLLFQTFAYAVKNGWLSESPCIGLKKPEVSEQEQRNSWDSNIVQNVVLGKIEAKVQCDELTPYYIQLVKVFIEAMFNCSARSGEMCGLRWSNIHFHQKEVQIDCTLDRVNAASLEKNRRDSIYFVFPTIKKGECSTRVVLKKTKTKKSRRTIFTPDSFIESLLHWKDFQTRSLPEDTNIYDLVFCNESGTPITPNRILRLLKKYIALYGLPEIVTHSLRASSSDFKLLLSEGDIKSVQGDTGHTNAKVLMDRYAVIRDTRRQNLASKVDQSFYHEKLSASDQTLSLDQVKNFILKNPEALVKILTSFNTFQ